MFAVGDGDGREPAKGTGLDVELQLVHPLQIPYDTPFRAVDLETVVVFAAWGKPRPLVVSHRAIGELDERLRGIIDIDLATPAAVRVLHLKHLPSSVGDYWHPLQKL